MSNIVVSPHYLSTNAGIEILQNGGNAIDAAIGTNIVQGVVAPETCGIGGDLFSLIWINGENTPYCLDSSGYAGSNVDISKLSTQGVSSAASDVYKRQGFHKSYGRLWVSKRFEKIIWGSFIVLAFYRYFN